MPAPDLPDWAQAVSTLEKVDSIAVAGGVLAANGATQTFDVSRYASVVVALGVAPGAVGQRYVLGMTWTDQGVSVYQESVSFHSDNSYPAAGTSPVWQGPSRAQSLILGLASDGAGNVPCAVFGSSRNLPGPVVSNLHSNQGRLLNRIFGTAIAAGASTSLYIPPVTAAVAIGWEPGVSTAIQGQLRAVSQLAGAFRSAQIWVATSTAAGFSTDPVPLAMTGAELFITNNDSVNRSPAINVWDVS